MWFLYALFFAFATSVQMALLKKLSSQISPTLLLIINNLFTLIFMSTIIFYLKIPFFDPFLWILVSIFSILDLIAAISSFKAIKFGDISLLSPLSSFNPLFTVLIASFALQELPKTIQILGILIIITGAYLLQVNSAKKSLPVPFFELLKNKAAALFLLANFIWAITPIFQKQAINLTDPQSPLFVSFLGLSAMTSYFLPYFFRNLSKATNFTKNNLGLLIILGLLNTLAQFAAFTAFSQANVGLVTAIFKLSPLFTIIWGFWFFKEKNIAQKLIASSIMIIGTLLLIL